MATAMTPKGGRSFIPTDFAGPGGWYRGGQTNQRADGRGRTTLDGPSARDGRRDVWRTHESVADHPARPTGRSPEVAAPAGARTPASLPGRKRSPLAYSRDWLRRVRHGNRRPVAAERTAPRPIHRSRRQVGHLAGAQPALVAVVPE